jgi:serine-type D-Ala-D-Ala carboxypeptidase/endopeptidase
METAFAKLVLFVAWVSLSLRSEAKEPDRFPVWRSIIESGVQHLKKQNLFNGGVIAVVESNREELWAFGTVSPESNIKPTADSIFEIGSLTKTFVGIILAELTIEKKLRLTDPVQNFIPELQGTFAGSATLEQLLIHQSGLPKMICRDPDKAECFVPKNLDNPYSGLATEELLLVLKSIPKPSNKAFEYEYSNLGYLLLGQVIARVDQGTFESSLKKRITDPLGMKDTAVQLSRQKAEKFLQGYTVIGSAAKHWDTSEAASAAGGIRSSGRDLLKFLKFSLTPDSSPLGQAILVSQRQAWGWDSKAGENLLRKDGETGGFYAMLTLDQNNKEGFVQLTNNVAGISAQLMDLAKGKPMNSFASKSVSEEILKSIDGEYRSEDSTDKTRFKIGHRESLVWIDDGESPAQLLALNDLEYNVFDGTREPGKIHLTFLSNHGKISGCLLRIHRPKPKKIIEQRFVKL